MVSMKAGSEFLSGEGALHQFKAYTEKMDLPEAVKQLQDKDEAMSAMGGMLSYLKELNLDRDLCTAGNFNIFNLHKCARSVFYAL